MWLVTPLWVRLPLVLPTHSIQEANPPPSHLSLLCVNPPALHRVPPHYPSHNLFYSHSGSWGADPQMVHQRNMFPPNLIARQDSIASLYSRTDGKVKKTTLMLGPGPCLGQTLKSNQIRSEHLTKKMFPLKLKAKTPFESYKWNMVCPFWSRTSNCYRLTVCKSRVRLCLFQLP